MKIHIDGIVYNSQKVGGIARYFNEVLNNISENYKDISIELLLHKPVEIQEKWFRQSAHIHTIRHIPSFKLYRFLKPIIQPLNEHIQNKYWKDIHDGVFHSTYFTNPKVLTIPRVLTVHDMIYEKFPQFFNSKLSREFIDQKRQCIESADEIICVSENTKKDLLHYYKVNSDKISVIYHGVNPLFQPIYDEQRKEEFLEVKGITVPYLLYVGMRNLYKNFNLFIESYSNLDISNLNVITIGGGPFTKEEKKLFKKLNMEDKIYNFNTISDEELVFMYNCAEAFVFPSLYEGFGIPLIEAMACGTPVVASNISSIPEVARDCILYFDPTDSKNMTQVIRDVLHDGRNTLRINRGLERAKIFTWNKTAQDTLLIYKKALSSAHLH